VEAIKEAAEKKEKAMKEKRGGKERDAM